MYVRRLRFIYTFIEHTKGLYKYIYLYIYVYKPLGSDILSGSCMRGRLTQPDIKKGLRNGRWPGGSREQITTVRNPEKSWT